jgi:hypothetical protein
MEGAASDGDHVYVVGSHSLRRKKVSEKAKYDKNREKLTRVTPHEESYSLYRVQLDDQGALKSRERVSLGEMLESNDILRPYTAIPSKENGVDIEGVAVAAGRVFVGFRGPVLRGNLVPVLSFEFERPDDYDLRFVVLEGRGIRDLAAVDGGFLVLAGPVGDGDASYKLYYWNGEDCLPGKGGEGGRIVTMAEVAGGDVKPEGMSVVAETSSAWQLMILSDGVGHATTWHVTKP